MAETIENNVAKLTADTSGVVKSFFAAAAASDKASKALEKLKAGAATLKGSFAGMVAEMRGVSDSTNAAASATDKIQQKLESQKQNVKDLQTELQALKKAYRDTSGALSLIPENYSGVADYRQALENGDGGFGKDAAKRELAELNEALKQYGEDGAEATRAGQQKIREEIRKTEKDIISERDAVAKTSGELEKAEEAANKAANGQNKLGSSARIAAAAHKALHSAGNIARKTLSGTVSLLKSGAGHLAKWASGLKNAARSSLSLDAAAKRLGKSINGVFAIIKRTALRSLIRTMFSGAGDSIKALAAESEELNAALSRMGSGVKQFSNSLSTVFQPAISAVAPLVTSMISGLTAGADKLAQFTAGLVGQDFYYSALPAQYDFAEAMDSTAKNTDKATKAQKAYTASVMSFDQLHKLNGSNDSIAETVKQFDKIPVSKVSKIGDFAKKLRDLFKSGNFGDVGSLLGGAGKKLFDYLDGLVKWSNSGDKITGKIRAVTDALNGLINRKDAFRSAGTLIGDTLTTLARSGREFFENVDWRGLGDSLGELFNSGIRTADWGDVGRVLSDMFMTPWNIFLGFVRKMDARGLGNALHNFISGALEKWDPATIGESIGTFVTKVSQALTTALTSKNDGGETVGETFGRKVKDGLVSFFKALSGKDLAEGINAIARAIRDAFGEIWNDQELRSEFLADVKDFLTTLDWAAAFAVASPIIAAAFVKALFAEIPKAWAASGGLVGLIKLMKSGGAAETAATAGGTAAKTTSGASGWAGLLDVLRGGGFREGLASLGPTVEKALNGIDDVFGSPIQKFNSRWFGNDAEARKNGTAGMRVRPGVIGSGATYAMEAGATYFSSGTQSDYIKSAIREGVREGMRDTSGSGRSFGSIEVPVYLDGEEVGRGIARANKRTNTRTNPRSSLGMAY